MKKNLFIVGFQIALLISISGFKCSAQSANAVYAVSTEIVDFILVTDAKCPIELSDAKLLGFPDGSTKNVYNIRNRAKQAIKKFQIVEFNWFGTPEFVRNISSSEDFSLDRNETIANFVNLSKLNILALNDDPMLLKKLNLNPKEKTLWIILVTRVELADGTTFDAGSHRETIGKFVHNLNFSDLPTKKEFIKKELQLREFILSIRTKR